MYQTAAFFSSEKLLGIRDLAIGGGLSLCDGEKNWLPSIWKHLLMVLLGSFSPNYLTSASFVGYPFFSMLCVGAQIIRL